MILGGIPKLEPIDLFLKRWKELECPLWVYGKAVEVWKKEFDATGLPVSYFPDIPTLITDLKNKIDFKLEANKGRKILALSVIFSPAGASFDLYKNFEERGNHFESLIKEEFS